MSSDEFNKSINETYSKTINNIESILSKGALICTGLAKQNLIDNKHYVTGALSKHTTAFVEGLKLEFGNDLDYAQTIETGISSSNASIGSIQEWLKRKVELGHMNRDMLGMALPIANKINSSGKIKNWNPFLQPSWEEMVITIDPLLKNSLVTD